MATKKDIIWFSGFLNQYDLGIKTILYGRAGREMWMDIRNIEESDNLEGILA